MIPIYLSLFLLSDDINEEYKTSPRKLFSWGWHGAKT